MNYESFSVPIVILMVNDGTCIELYKGNTFGKYIILKIVELISTTMDAKDVVSVEEAYTKSYCI